MDLYEFQTSLVYKVSFRTAKAMQRETLSQKTKQNKTKQSKTKPRRQHVRLDLGKETKRRSDKGRYFLTTLKQVEKAPESWS